MNANFGILPELEEKIKDKKLKYEKLADRGLASLDNKKIFLYNDIENGINASKLYTSFIRKNLMIIEILENFIIYLELGHQLLE